MKPGVTLTLLVAAVLSCRQPAGAEPLTFAFTTIDVPGSTSTDVYGINNAGQITGTYRLPTDDLFTSHAFLDTNGVFTTIHVPQGLSSQSAYGINDSGQIVILTQAPLIGPDSFLETDGVFALIGPGLGIAASGINNQGQIVGYSISGNGAGFIDTGGVFTTIRFPGSGVSTYPGGINNAGQVAGGVTGDGSTQGFLYANGSFTALSFYANGINDEGEIAGYRNMSGVLDTNRVQTLVQFPGASATYLLGINNAGDIIGNYDMDGSTHGFLATPVTIPEPGSILLLMIGLAGVAARMRMRQPMQSRGSRVAGNRDVNCRFSRKAPIVCKDNDFGSLVYVCSPYTASLSASRRRSLW